MRTQVLIIGAGPIGMMASLLLSNQGISSIIVERRLERMTAPKAHAVNPRTIEICDAAGLPGADLRAEGSPVDLAGHVRFASTLAGMTFGSLPYERQTEAALEITPFPLINISQPRFEASIARILETKDDIALFRGAECRELRQSPTHVTASVHIRGARAPLEIDADYVLAADGAGSRTREALRIEMEGPETLQNYVMIHCEGDLGAYTKACPGVLVFTFDPRAGGVFIFYDDMKSWVFMKAYNPEAESPDAFDEARCRQEIQESIGVDAPFRIKNISPWRMTAQIAQSYRSGRVFLIGDAAHRFPPTGGLGLNTGVGDAHNLAWKLAAVLHGRADDALLATYETERRPVAKNNSEQSLTNAAKMFDLIAALQGPDPASAADYFARQCAEGAQSKDIRSAVEAQRPHFDSIHLQLGYRYHSPALIGSIPLEPDPDQDISVYKPSYAVGALLPHEWVSDNVSLLSQLTDDKFALVCGPKGNDWSNAVQQISDIHVVRRETPWPSAADLAADAALLIRPDGHIAARYAGKCENAGETLERDLQRILSSSAGTGA